MSKSGQRQKWWLVWVTASTIPLVLVFGPALGMTPTGVIVVAFFAGLACGWMALWMRANARAVGGEWWQDDSCSGWRGY